MPNPNHIQNDTNILDPDDGLSWLCTACNLPIFATPFSGGGCSSGPLLHDQCAKLPVVLQECELHPKQPLFLRDNNNNETCSECSQNCGSKLYYCQDSGCGLVLDVACALPVKILHRSHRHRLVAVRGGSTNGTCGVCGVSHTIAVAAGARSYSCNVCSFWIHPDCATSANVIKHVKHDHPLVLYYDVGAAFGAQYSTPIDFVDFFNRQAPKNDNRCSRDRCVVCENDVEGARAGIYACIKCRDGIFHISCATSDPRSFTPVLSREAQFPSLVRLPMKDEHQSIVGYLRNATSNNNGDDEQIGRVKDVTIFEKRLEPFKLQKNSDEDGCRVCDACLKIIDTPTIYASSINPNVLLHEYCYHLPRFLSPNPAHTPGHNFGFILGDDPVELLRLIRSSCCGHCGCQWFRACYFCWQCRISPQRYILDVSCALMPNVVTHEAHSTAHFLRLPESNNSRRSRGGDPDCACCLRPLGKLAYECRTCDNFAIHTWCAMLPKTVAHKFDPHPLRLTTTGCLVDICEICEREIKEKVWRYGCESCDQSFHVDCIPCLDMNYKIKSLGREGVQIPNFPKRLIRGLTLQGHGHGEEYCKDVADEYDDPWESD